MMDVKRSANYKLLINWKKWTKKRNDQFVIIWSIIEWNTLDGIRHSTRNNGNKISSSIYWEKKQTFSSKICRILRERKFSGFASMNPRWNRGHVRTYLFSILPPLSSLHHLSFSRVQVQISRPISPKSQLINELRVVIRLRFTLSNRISFVKTRTRNMKFRSNTIFLYFYITHTKRNVKRWKCKKC